MRVNQIDTPRPHSRSDSSRSSNIPIGSHRDRRNREAFSPRFLNEG
jgi:hypothetical protein